MVSKNDNTLAQHLPTILLSRWVIRPLVSNPSGRLRQGRQPNSWDEKRNMYFRWERFGIWIVFGEAYWTNNLWWKHVVNPAYLVLAKQLGNMAPGKQQGLHVPHGNLPMSGRPVFMEHPEMFATFFCWKLRHPLYGRRGEIERHELQGLCHLPFQRWTHRVYHIEREPPGDCAIHSAASTVHDLWLGAVWMFNAGLAQVAGT